MQLNIEEHDFYVRPGVTDMRKRATGLSRIVQNQMKMMPFSKAVFLFESDREHERFQIDYGVGKVRVVGKSYVMVVVFECSA